MKLKIYNQQNSKISLPSKPTVRVHCPSGIISLSKAACHLIGLRNGDKLIIVQDEDSPEDFFIHKTTHPEGFTVRSKTGEAGATFNSSKIAKMLAPGYNAVSFPVSAAQVIDGMSYHLIVTSKPINHVAKAIKK